MTLLFRHYSAIQNDAARGFQVFSVCRQAVAFLTGVILAKSALTSEEIGIYEVWMFVGLIISFAGLSGVLQAFLAHFSKATQDRKKAFLFTTYVLMWILTGLLALLILGFKDIFFNRLLGIPVIQNLPLVLGFLLLHLNAILVPYFALAIGNSKYLLPYSLFYFFGNILAVILPIYFSGSLSTILYSLLIWGLLEQLVLVFMLVQNAHLSFSLSFFKLLISVAIPLAMYSGSGLLAQIFDAWLVNFEYQDLSIFALFKYGAREVPGAIALASAFSASMIVVYVSSQKNSLERIKNGSRKFMHFFFPFSFLLLFFSDRIFGVLYSDFFRDSAVIFNTYLLLMISRWVFPQAILIGMGKHMEVFWISVLELVINMVVSLWLIRYFGLVGIAMGTVVAFWFEKVFMIILLETKYQIKMKEYIPIRYFTIYSLLMIVGYLAA